MIDRYCVSLSTVGPEKLPIQVITHSIKNTPKVATKATIWFFVRLEMKSPTDTKHPPSSSRPR